MPADQVSKDLALGIVDFLKTSINNGTISSEDADSVEVAIDCLTDIFDVNLENKDKVYGKNNLLSIFNAFLKLKERKKSSAEPAAAGSAEPEKAAEVSEEDKAKAEDLKNQGNDALRAKDYQKAIDLYTQSIELDPKNVIYYSNRAAAYSTFNQNENAAEDAKKAIEIDPSYAKGYSRLGHALLSLGDAQGAIDAYQKGLKLEGSNPSPIMQRGLQAAQEKALGDLDDIVDVQADSSSSSTRDVSSASADADADADAGAGAGPGGFDFASMMNNPQIQQMAQNLMSNPNALSGLMNNPMLKQMADKFQNGAGMPDMNDIINNPALQSMAQNFMGGKK